MRLFVAVRKSSGLRWFCRVLIAALAGQRQPHVVQVAALAPLVEGAVQAADDDAAASAAVNDDVAETGAAVVLAGPLASRDREPENPRSARR